MRVSSSSVRARSDCVSEASLCWIIGFFWTEMMLIFGLMLLLETAACVERFCSFYQSDPCIAVLGDKLKLQLSLDSSEYGLRIQKIINSTDKEPVCRIMNGTIQPYECGLYNDRSEVSFIDGILIINSVIRADSGNYRLIVFNSDGIKISSEDLQVIVEAPIGSVEVSIICSSSGGMRASCSSDGDPLFFSWTLNGDPLMDGNATIDLDEGTEGIISCSVKNHVSHRQKPVILACPAVFSASLVHVLVWCFQMMVLLGLLGGFHIYMRHVRKETGRRNSENEQI